MNKSVDSGLEMEDTVPQLIPHMPVVNDDENDTMLMLTKNAKS